MSGFHITPQLDKHKMHISLIQDQLYGSETINDEFKEFFMSFSQYFSDETIEEKFFNNNSALTPDDIALFNKMIHNDIHAYILKYFSKYFCNFMNSQIEGNLTIGVTDDGIIEGIPFFGSRDQFLTMLEQILEAISLNNEIEECLKISTPDGKKHVLENLITASSISICNVNSVMASTFKLDMIKFELNKRINENHKLIRTFQHEKNNWVKRYKHYDRSLNNIINDPEMRKELIDFINAKKSPTDDVSGVIEFLKSPVYVSHTINFEFVDAHRFETNHYVKWLIEFKDYMRTTIYKDKPLLGSLKRIPKMKSYYDFVGLVGNVRKYLIANECNFFILNINFPKNTFDEYTFKYCDTKNKWKVCKRMENNQGPFSHHIKN